MYHISLLHAQESWLSCQWEKQLQGGSGSSMTPAKQETTVWDNVILRNYKYYKLGNFGTFCCMLLNQNTDRLKNTSRSSSSFRLGLWQQNRVVEGKIEIWRKCNILTYQTYSFSIVPALHYPIVETLFWTRATLKKHTLLLSREQWSCSMLTWGNYN